MKKLFYAVCCLCAVLMMTAACENHRISSTKPSEVEAVTVYRNEDSLFVLFKKTFDNDSVAAEVRIVKIRDLANFYSYLIACAPTKSPQREIAAEADTLKDMFLVALTYRYADKDSVEIQPLAFEMSR